MSATHVVGTQSVEGASNVVADPTLEFKYTPTTLPYGGTIRNGYDYCSMWFRTEGLAPVLMYLAVYPNGKQFFWSNQFLFDNNYAHNTWIHLDLPLGPETTATTITGDQNSWNSPITWIYWSSHAHGNGVTSVLIDDLYFHPNKIGRAHV